MLVPERPATHEDPMSAKPPPPDSSPDHGRIRPAAESSDEPVPAGSAGHAAQTDAHDGVVRRADHDADHDADHGADPGSDHDADHDPEAASAGRTLTRPTTDTGDEPIEGFGTGAKSGGTNDTLTDAQPGKTAANAAAEVASSHGTAAHDAPGETFDKTSFGEQPLGTDPLTGDLTEPDLSDIALTTDADTAKTLGGDQIDPSRVKQPTTEADFDDPIDGLA